VGDGFLLCIFPKSFLICSFTFFSFSFVRTKCFFSRHALVNVLRYMDSQSGRVERGSFWTAHHLHIFPCALD